MTAMISETSAVRSRTDKRLVAVNATSSISGWLFSLVFIVWVQQYLVRRITPEEYSLLPVLMSLMIPLPVIATAFTSAMGRHATECYARGDDAGIADLASSTMPALGVIAVIILAAGAMLVGFVDRMMVIPTTHLAEVRLMMALIIAMYVIRMFAAPISIGVFVTQRHWAYHLLSVLCELLRQGVTAALLIGVSVRILWLVVGLVASSLVETTVMVLLSVHYLPALRTAGSVHWTLTWKTLRFGSWVVVDQIGGMLFKAMDPLLLNRYATPAAVGSFNLGSLPSRHLQSMVEMGAGAVSPVLVTLHAHGKREELESAFIRLGRYALWVGGMLCPFWVLRNEVYGLYLGPRAQTYSTAADVALITLLSLVPMHSVFALQRIAYACNRPRACNTIMLVCQVCNLGVTWVLVKHYQLGAYGSALGNLIALWGATALGLLPLSFRSFGVSPKRYLTETLLRGLIPWGCSFAVLLLWTTPACSWMAVLVRSVIATAAYGVAILVLLNASEKRDVARVLSEGKAMGRRALARCVGVGHVT